MKFFKTLTKGSWRFQWVVYYQFRFVSIMDRKTARETVTSHYAVVHVVDSPDITNAQSDSLADDSAVTTVSRNYCVLSV